MVDKKWIGKKYPASVYEIGKEKLREFAIAVEDTNPLYMDDEKAKAGPYGGVIAPPMFAVVYAKGPVGACLFDGDLALNFAMLVHGEQEFEFLAPVRPGDVITTDGFVENIYDKKNLDFVTLKTESVNQNGEKVLNARWTFVIRNI